jgi:formylglycine-generating enzyme required for sulfatase activity
MTSKLHTPLLFSTLLAQHLQALLYSPGQLSRLSGVPKRTIVNWLDGTVAHPRRWQSVARVAAALRLDVTQTDQLLRAASCGTLAQLVEGAEGPDRLLLAAWPEVEGHTQEQRLLRQYLEKLDGVLSLLPSYFPRDAATRFAEFYVDPQLRPLESGPNELAGWPTPYHEGEHWSSLRLQTRRAVILGQPGMGKSWLLKGEALRLVREALAQPETETVQALPIFVRVAELAQMLTLGSTVEEILRAMAVLAAQMTPALPQAQLGTALLRALMQRPEQILLLLDAVDEVPDYNQARAIARRAVILVGRATVMRLLLTSRTLGYASAPLAREMGPDVTELELAAWDNRRINQTIRTWFGERLEPARQLHIAMRRAPALIRQASNPLLLSLMCLLTDTHGVTLSRSRSEMYEPVLRLLLEGRWRSFDLHLPESRIYLKLRLLEKIAWMFATYQGGWSQQLSGDVIEPLLEGTEEARRLWRTWRPEWGARYEGTLYELSEWDGILVRSYIPRDGAFSAVPYTFLHRSFQEYLVSRHLLRCYQAAGIEAAEVQQFLHGHVVNADWYVVLVLLIEQLTQWPEAKAKALLEALSGELVARMGPKPGHLDIAAMELLLSLQATIQQQPLQTLVTRLAELMVNVEARPHIRVHAARLVANVGDPRPEVMEVDAIEWVEVPGGTFRMGSDREVDLEAFPEELPQFCHLLPTFAITRHPISYAQFRRFHEEKEEGYGNPAWWPEAIALGHWRGGMVWRTGLPQPGREQNKPLARWSTTLNPLGWPAELPNSPVAGLNWYEARAFVRWLEHRWRELGKLAADEWLDLPSEAEWEKAARGVDGRIYPWGNTFDSNRLNWYGQMLMAMTPIGCFPNSVSPYGVEEMVGNLWEFTRTIYAPYGRGSTGEGGWIERDFADHPTATAQIALRGGAHSQVRARCRAAARIGVLPFAGTNSTFRMVKRRLGETKA